VAIGDAVLDLSVVAEQGLFEGKELRNQDVFEERSLNAFMELGPAARKEARGCISRLLTGEDGRLKNDA
jgi:fumarylacetoacetase